jgi:hypothetical protein
LIPFGFADSWGCLAPCVRCVSLDGPHGRAFRRFSAHCPSRSMKRVLAIAGSVLLFAALTLWASGYRLPTAWTGSVGRTLDRLEGEGAQDSSRASASPPAAAERTDAADSTLVSPVSQGYRFRIWKPPSATVDTTQVRGHPFVRFTVAGPENDPPALTDGFTLTVALALVRGVRWTRSLRRTSPRQSRSAARSSTRSGATRFADARHASGFRRAPWAAPSPTGSLRSDRRRWRT